MRILYFHQYFSPSQLPGGTRSYEFAGRLIARGHQVEVITSSAALRGDYQLVRSASRTEIAGIPKTVLPVPYSNAMGFRDRILAFCKFATLASVQAMRRLADDYP